MCVAIEYVEDMLTDKEIFSNWLKEIIKLKGIVKGKDLALDVGVAPGTISGWFGDKSKGPEKDVGEKICDILTNKYKFPCEYDQIIKTGRKKFESKTNKTRDLEQRISVLESLIPSEKFTKSDYKTDIEKHILSKHQMRVKDFPTDCQEKAYEINNKLIEISKIEPGYLDDLDDILNKKLKRLSEKESRQASTGSAKKQGSA